jgi:SAM-dependent methyltransferase
LDTALLGPALARTAGRLERGAKVGELDCGSGPLSIALALRFPASRFFGFDPHPPAIALARRQAAVVGLADRVRFQTAAAGDFPGTGYQLILQLDAHGYRVDHLRVLARHIRRTLAPDGCWVFLEPGGPHCDPTRLTRVVFEGGFTRVRCAPATPTELYLEARP